jgi:hypothetical protein
VELQHPGVVEWRSLNDGVYRQFEGQLTPNFADVRMCLVDFAPVSPAVPVATVSNSVTAET